MKIKQSKTEEINRSQIEFAAYNPRKKSDEVVKSLMNNFKKVGFLGGIVWNSTTGNLVSGHKRVEALDKIHKYDGKNDYKLKVETIAVDLTKEMEQNVYMNNIEQQGEYDYQKLAFIVPDIDMKAAGLTEFQIEKTAVFMPPKEIKETKQVKPPELTEEEKEARKEEVKAAKDSAKEKYFERHDNLTNSHVTIAFDTWDEKVSFLEMLGFDIEDKFIKGPEFLAKLETISLF